MHLSQVTPAGSTTYNAPKLKNCHFQGRIAEVRLELLNPAGVPSIKLVCSGSSDAFNLVWAAAPQNSGTRRAMNLNYLGELPEVVAGKSDITTLYTAKFGAPVAGQRIFVSSRQMKDGWQDVPKAFSGVVPASS